MCCTAMIKQSQELGQFKSCAKKSINRSDISFILIAVAKKIEIRSKMGVVYLDSGSDVLKRHLMADNMQNSAAHI